jgi:hypothetical protein
MFRRARYIIELSYRIRIISIFIVSFKPFSTIQKNPKKSFIKSKKSFKKQNLGK